MDKVGVATCGVTIGGGMAECIIVLCAVCCLQVVVIRDVVEPNTDEPGDVSNIVASNGELYLEPYVGTCKGINIKRFEVVQRKESLLFKQNFSLTSFPIQEKLFESNLCRLENLFICLASVHSLGIKLKLYYTLLEN